MIKFKLSKILGEKRITQAELIRKTNINHATISRLYHETTNSIDFTNLDKICKALDCTPNDLLEFTKN